MEIDVKALDMLTPTDEAQLMPCFATCFNWTACFTTYYG